jgi:hypothetical protein
VADVAELADALDSKSGTRKSVWVRPPPSAPLLWVATCTVTVANIKLVLVAAVAVSSAASSKQRRARVEAAA